MKKWLSVLLVAVMTGSLLAGATRLSAEEAYTVRIDPGTSYQTIEGWGTSLAWWGNVIGGWSSPKREEIIDQLFDPYSGLGLNIVRYNIGGGENPAYQPPYRVGAVMPSFQPTEGVWDWSADSNQRYVLQRAKSLGANIFEAFANAPPYWMTLNQCSAGSANGGNNLREDYYDDYADYMTEVVKRARDDWGIHFRTIAPLNEPISTWWKCGNNQEGIHFDADKQDRLLNEVLQKLNQKGLTGVHVSGPEEYSVDQSLSSFNGYSASVKAGMSQLNTHTYAGSKEPILRSAAVLNQLKLWVSEVGVGGTASQSPLDMTSAQELAGKINSDLRNLQPVAWVEWQAVENRQLQHNWGFIQADFSGTEDYWLNKQYWTMANYSKFIRPGFKIIASDHADTLSAIDPVSGKLVLVTRNPSTTDTAVTYDLSLFDSLPASAAVYRTSTDENLAILPSANISGGTLSSSLKANSITTFVIEGSGYEGLGSSRFVNDSQFNYTGAWSSGSQTGAYEHDLHWSEATDASFELAFSGTQVSLYGAKAPNQGIAAISIDGGLEELVDLYAQTREDDIFLYTSPLLLDGTHTIKVRVTGLKNSTSSAPIVSADRIVITSSVPSLLGNSGFESTSFAPWSGEWNPSLTGVETSYPYSGLQDAYLHPTTTKDVALYQTIAAPESRTYILTAHAATSMANTASLGVDVGGVQQGEVTVSNSGKYDYYQLKFHADAGQPIKVWYYAKRNSGWATIDEVILR
ncbi:glycoside hydrolase family 30 protein [Paenibacillus bouchesdurhonensis]|uniref:glycoside hydrolase family 30 protein n=1 Tax=Paenibacillus bouchesdurhonensis TaxID=1870990 RepID=UPI000DA611CD|nr:glycoside hydrolase [Paenibacillus bouchesdurhonensis]